METFLGVARKNHLRVREERFTIYLYSEIHTEQFLLHFLQFDKQVDSHYLFADSNI